MQIIQKVIFTATVGLVTGFIELFMAISFAILVFSGDLEVFAARGIGIFIASAFVVIVITPLFTSIKGAFGSVQDVSTVLLAVIAAGIASRLSNPNSEEAYYTVLMAIGLNSIFLAILFVLIRRFQLADVIRTLPYPVIGGLIAGTGWLYLQGGLNILTGAAPIADYLQNDVLSLWLPGVVFGLIILGALRRYDNFLIVPGLLVGGIFVFYVVFFLTGTTVDQAQANGFLLGPFPTGDIFKPLTPAQLDKVDWSVLFGSVSHVPAILAISSITFVLNISSLELILREDADIDQELMTAGVSNGIVGIFGGAIGFHSLSLTTMARRMGVKNGIYAIVAAGLSLVVLIIGTSMLEYFPKPILGGMLIYLGLSFLVEWLIDAYHHIPRIDHAIIVVMIVAIATIGFMEGVIIGILLAVLAFAFDYSRIEIIRHHWTGTEYQSTVRRPNLHRHVLHTKGEMIEIYELQGFLFFGTSNALYSRIRNRVDIIQYLILDCRRVVKLDSSAIYSLQKLRQLCEQNGIQLIMASVPKRLAHQLSGVDITRYDDLDQALEYAEEQILQESLAPDAHADLSTLMNMLPTKDLKKLFGYMEHEYIVKGTVLADQGAPSDAMFFLIKGMLGIYLDMPNTPAYRISTIREGTIVGEIGTYLEIPRSASIVVEKDSEVLRFDKDAMQRLEEDDPGLASRFHEQIVHILAQRLVDATHALEAALE